MENSMEFCKKKEEKFAKFQRNTFGQGYEKIVYRLNRIDFNTPIVVEPIHTYYISEPLLEVISL